jgi:hypothetical protein
MKGMSCVRLVTLLQSKCGIGGICNERDVMCVIGGLVNLSDGGELLDAEEDGGIEHFEAEFDGGGAMGVAAGLVLAGAAAVVGGEEEGAAVEELEEEEEDVEADDADGDDGRGAGPGHRRSGAEQRRVAAEDGAEEGAAGRQHAPVREHLPPLHLERHVAEGAPLAQQAQKVRRQRLQRRRVLPWRHRALLLRSLHRSLVLPLSYQCIISHQQ